MSEGRAVIFANGELRDAAGVAAQLRSDDLLIAADGGLRHARALGRLPHLLIGDLDSVDPADLPGLEAAGVEIRRYPPAKNETDLELALQAALAQGCTRLLIVAALGGRLDMTLGNIFLLNLPELEFCDARLEDGAEEVFLIRSQGEIEGRPGDTVSLLPLGGAAEGVLTHGLGYPLHSETLYPERTRGISNVMEGRHALVQIESGLLICIHTRIRSNP